jgi:hypothetical protein
MMKGPTAHCAIHTDSGIMSVACDGAFSEYVVRRMPHTRSSFNFVFAIAEKPDLVLRVSKRPLDERESAMYASEVAMTRDMAALGIAPRIFGTAIARIGATSGFPIGIPDSGDADVHVGMLMQKYDVSLACAQSDETLLLELFLRCRGEEAVAALYYTASEHIGIIDAKPGNVVARRTSSGVELALIDFDTRFCARAPRFSRSHEPQASALRAIDEALESFGADRCRRDAIALRAALTLFVYCFVSAWQAGRDAHGAFPYARTAEILARHSRVIMLLVALDESGDPTFRLVPHPASGDAWTVASLIAEYSRHKHTVVSAMELVARAAARPHAALLRACADEHEHYPDAYARGVRLLYAGNRFASSASDSEIRFWATSGEKPRAVRRSDVVSS